eukprot:COSAG02_NODE_1262_length_13556_cov_11.011522_6_plen_246_part_00
MLTRLERHVAPHQQAAACDRRTPGAHTAAAVKAQLDAAIRAHTEHVPAVAVGVVKADGTILCQAEYGTRRVERGWPVQGDSIFQIASISKTVTGVCAMMCVERGLLQLDDDVSGLTATHGGFGVHNPRFPDTPVTLRMLMSHTSSVHDSSVYEDSYTAGDSQWSLADFCREYFSGSLRSDDIYTEHAPGAAFDYSNVGAGLVGYLVEAASGMLFADFAEQNVLQPLGMQSSSFLWAGLQSKGVDL